MLLNIYKLTQTYEDGEGKYPIMDIVIVYAEDEHDAKKVAQFLEEDSDTALWGWMNAECEQVGWGIGERKKGYV